MEKTKTSGTGDFTGPSKGSHTEFDFETTDPPAIELNKSMTATLYFIGDTSAGPTAITITNVYNQMRDQQTLLNLPSIDTINNYNYNLYFNWCYVYANQTANTGFTPITASHTLAPGQLGQARSTNFIDVGVAGGKRGMIKIEYPPAVRQTGYPVTAPTNPTDFNSGIPCIVDSSNVEVIVYINVTIKKNVSFTIGPTLREKRPFEVALREWGDTRKKAKIEHIKALTMPVLDD